MRREIKGYPGSRPAALRYVSLLPHIASVDTSRFHSSKEGEGEAVIANRRNHRSDPMEISCGARSRGGIIFS